MPYRILASATGEEVTTRPEERAAIRTAMFLGPTHGALEVIAPDGTRVATLGQLIPYSPDK